MTFDDKLDKILLSHGAEQGELNYSSKQAIKDLVLSDVVGGMSNALLSDETIDTVKKMRQSVINSGGKPNVLKISNKYIESMTIFGMKIEIVSSLVMPDNVSMIVYEDKDL